MYVCKLAWAAMSVNCRERIFFFGTAKDRGMMEVKEALHYNRILLVLLFFLLFDD